jgi:hypothetical protein
MRILLLTIGARGDVQPFIALGQRLKQNGHDVALCTSSSFSSFVERQGLEYRYLNNDLVELAQGQIGRKAMGFDGRDLAPVKGRSQTKGDGSAEDEIRAWSSRLKMARGSLAGISNRLVRELPRVKTPWERILRDFLFRHARRKRLPDPSRPSRRWLALESDLREREGVDLPFESATSATRTGRVALAVDTSGSIDESLLRRFAAEVATVLEKTEPLLRLIVCDADVHQVQDFSGREGAELLWGFKFKGGGGTDFRPAIAEAAKWKPDLLIYLTDLEGDAGDEPAFPAIWAVPEGKAESPWGKVVELS